VIEGGYYSSDLVTLLMVRPITIRQADWAEAERKWYAARAEAAKDG
jgi:hypothetical protein